MFKARIRGIYATALTKLVLDLRGAVTQASYVIISRFKIERPISDVPDLTIKDSEKIRGAIVLIGKRWAVKAFLKHLVDLCDDVVVWRCRVPLHSIIMGVVTKVEGGRALVKLSEDVEGVLPISTPGLYRENDVIPVTVVRTATLPSEEVLVSADLRVDGDYASLIPENRIVLSRHIRDPDRRAELMSLGMMCKEKVGDLGIKWRSSSQYASMDELIREIDKLIERYNEIKRRTTAAKPYEVIQEGEYIAEVVIGGRCRERLDDIRNQVVPTVIGHHSLKMFSRRTSAIDFVEHLLSYVPDRRREMSKGLVDYMMSRRAKVIIYHMRPDGKLIKIGPSRVLKYESDTKSLILHRRLRPGGVLDGLGVPKEEGDYALSYVRLGEEFLAHAYFNGQGGLKGIYVNVNTPVEIVRRGVYYIDLLVDVVKRGDEVKVIDIEELERLRAQGVISESLYRRATSLAEMLKERAKELEDLLVRANRELSSYL